jgi:hypothetical protein
MLVASLVISHGIAVLQMGDLSTLLERLATNVESLVTCKDISLASLATLLLTFQALATAHRRLPTVTFLVKLLILVLPLRLHQLRLSHNRSLRIATI